MEKSILRIRTADNSDCAAVQALVFPIMEAFGLDPAPQGADADLLDIESAYNRQGGWLEIVSADDSLVGTVGMLPTGEKLIELRKMYLHPDFRGQGLGSALLARSLRRALDAGFSHVILETSTNLKAAITLYRHFGFERDFDNYPGCGKNACDQVWKLSLANYSEKNPDRTEPWTEVQEGGA